jgi:tetratricopeptide (TPR) repeat protein
MAIEGPLKELGIHDVFQLLDLSRKTGILRVSSQLRQNAGTVVFDQGGVVFAEIKSNPHPLGSVLLQAGKVREEDLHRARDMQKGGDKRRLGDILVEIGAVSRRELQRQVRAQVEAVVFELMSWSEGYFSFEEGVPADKLAEAEIRIPVEAVLMEGARRIDEWSQIQTRIPHLGIIPRFAAADSGSLDLHPDEWSVLAVIDGERDVREVASAIGRPEFEVAKTIFGLATAGVVGLDQPHRPVAAASHRELAILIARTEDRLAEGDAQGALLAAQEVMATHPLEPMAHLVLGRALLGLHRAPEAVDAFKRVLQYEPTSAAGQRYLGLALVAAGKFREAADQLMRWSRISDMPPEEQSLEALVEQARNASLALDEAMKALR